MNLLQAVLSAELESVAIVDTKGMLVEVNPAGLAFLEEPSLASAQRRPAIEHVDPAHRDVFAGLLQTALSGGQAMADLEITGAHGT